MNGQYRLEAFGLQAPWVLWRIANGGLDEPELESAHERRRLFRDDFGSIEDYYLALRLWPEEVDSHLDPMYARRMAPKPVAH